MKDPRSVFLDYLAKLLKSFKKSNKELIIYRDFNEDVYSGVLSCQLQEHGVEMKEQVFQSTSTSPKVSHVNGSKAIDVSLQHPE